VKDYVTKMINAEGMKVMLLDEETTAIVSLVYAQSEILQKEVYLLERVNNTAREVMTHLKAIVFVRPTQESLDALVAELKRPKYGSYDIYFSNIIKSTQLERLAEADEHEVVQEVQEYFADYLACGSSLVTFGLHGCVDSSNPAKWNPKIFTRVSQGLTALMLSLKRRPVIRYQASSDLCRDLAGSIGGTIERERSSLFDFRQTDPAPVLVVVDRRDDPVTPLLNQWTYQAMVHELLGIQRNRVSLKGVPGISKDLEQVVLSEKQDAFYRENMYKNFGEIGEAIKRMVDEFQERSKKNAKLDSIQDMKAFVESYPEFRAMSGSVSKHVSVVGELSRQVSSYNVFDLSAAEQELACQTDHKGILDQMDQLFADEKIRPQDKVRITMLYALRYGTDKASELDTFVGRLVELGVDPQLRELVSQVQQYAGAGQQGRSSNIFGEATGARGLFKKMTGGMKGVENVYTQHEPLLKRTLAEIKGNRLKEAAFPYVGSPMATAPQDVFVFMVGGTTYAESRVVAEFNEENPDMRVVLAATCLHNFETFQTEMYGSGGGGGGGGGRR